MYRTVIIGTGCYIPTSIKTNTDFAMHTFYGEDYKSIDLPGTEITQKFQDITGIEERRYAAQGQNTSDLAFLASERAIADAKIDKESLDQIIVAHNYGEVPAHHIQSDTVPAIASRLKQKLGIYNPSCVAYDILFGCPGWLQGVIQADAFFKAGIAKRILVVGAETLSRVIDPYDRDSMIFSDGAGATVLQYMESDDDAGIISYSVQSHCVDEAGYINFGQSYLPASDPTLKYIKMKGRKVYEYAIKYVPAAMKDCLDKAGISILDVKKVFIHQANEKMDQGIIKVLFRLYGIKEVPENVMPMNIHKFGNSSVATIPTLYDQVLRNELGDHQLEKGDIVLFASVGAGMNINAVCYRV
jgi:3-oxoacyl-[acyl-carrier-protein] synthase-3